MKNEIWVEKYRPSNFNEVIGQNIQEIKNHLDNLPHLLFISKSPGTGKTSVAKLIIKELKSNYLILNASDERGIDTIRKKVKEFAMTMSTNNRIKIIFLDEADYLTREAQPALRNMMETYASNCRFILTANYENKIIEPLRSRCTIIRFQNPEKNDIVHHLIKICFLENLSLETNTLTQLVEQNYPDMRRMINKLQHYSITNNPKILLSQENELSTQLYENMKKKDFWKCRELVLSINVDIDDIIMEIHNLILKDIIPPEKKYKLIKLIGEYNKFSSLVPHKDILFETFLIESIEVI